MQKPKIVIEIDEDGKLARVYASTDIAGNIDVAVIDYTYFGVALTPSGKQCEHEIETSKVVRVYGN